jgi:hypothetical protein
MDAPEVDSDDAEWDFPVSTSPVRKRHGLPKNDDELRVMRVLAFHEARERRAQVERDARAAAAREAAKREAAREWAFTRKFNCDLAMFKNVADLRAYVLRWDTPYSPGTPVHTSYRKCELVGLIARKPWKELAPNLMHLLDQNTPLLRMQHWGNGVFLKKYDEVLGKPYRLLYEDMPSVYALQLLAAHVNAYSSERSAGWFPHEQLPVWQHFFRDSFACRREARELLRCLFLLAKQHDVSLNGYAPFVALVLRQLPHCAPHTSVQLSIELDAMRPGEDVPIGLYSPAKRAQVPKHIRERWEAEGR